MPQDDGTPFGPMEGVFLSDVSPLLVKIHELCEKHGIPFVAVFQLDSVPGKGTLSGGTCHLDPHYTEMRLRMMASIAAEQSITLYRGDVDENGKLRIAGALEELTPSGEKN